MEKCPAPAIPKTVPVGEYHVYRYPPGLFTDDVDRLSLSRLVLSARITYLSSYSCKYCVKPGVDLSKWIKKGKRPLNGRTHVTDNYICHTLGDKVQLRLFHGYERNS